MLVATGSVNTLIHLGRLNLMRGDLARAQPLLDSALAGMNATLGSDHIDRARYSTALVALYEARGDVRQAAMWKVRLGR